MRLTGSSNCRFIKRADSRSSTAQDLAGVVSLKRSISQIADLHLFLQTMKEISSEHSTTTILPVPIDLFAPFIKTSERRTPKES
jgi:hypothetical protein